MAMNEESVFHAYRYLLFSIAYRMLGSIMDAEDCLQETFLRWHEACENGEAEAIRSPRSYLCTVVTRQCIDVLRSARVQREAYVGVWLPEPLVTAYQSGASPDPEASVEQSESLSLAFLRLLEYLSPLERAVFLLRQVFDFEYDEIAQIVQKSPQNCRQIMRRARHNLAEHNHHYNVPPELRELMTYQFIQACTTGDMQGLLHVLADDVVMHSDGGGKVRAALKPIYGAAKVARGLLGLMRKIPPGATSQLALVNGQLGILTYLDGAPYAVLAFSLVNDRIQEIALIVNPDKLRGILPLA
jgi:RNA polymerase sigma-70 factor (ECF subfamily)